MKSIFSVIAANTDSAVVLVHRHFDYVTKHVMAWVKDSKKVTALNYSEKLPPCIFPLSKKGCEHGWRQGKQFAEAGIEPAEIIGSFQGRGPESGVRIMEGYEEVTGKAISMDCDMAANWPVYNYDEAVEGVTDEHPAQWMNGQCDNLIIPAPESFKSRVTGLISELLGKGGVRIITTHFEICVLTHALYIEGKDLGSISETYAPQKGGGILIVRHEDGTTESYDYDADLNLL